ncbi:hypothetical protein [Halobacillus mangrovi]|uniref:hypothetical protein n=1 Tax=Halobacillus mangrovi TaxID=402384 RepID=UPI003D95DE9F
MDKFRLALLLTALFVFVNQLDPSERRNEQATEFTFTSSGIVISDQAFLPFHPFVTKEKRYPYLALTALFLLFLLINMYNQKPQVRWIAYFASRRFMIQRKFHSKYLWSSS